MKRKREKIVDCNGNKEMCKMTKEMERASDDRHRLRFLVDVVVVVTVLIGDQDRKGKREKNDDLKGPSEVARQWEGSQRVE